MRVDFLFVADSVKAENKANIISEVAYYDRIIFKFRPSYTIKDNGDTYLLELLLGKPFALGDVKCVLYLDFKSNLDDAFGLGPRLATTYRIHRTFLGFEGVYFFALDRDSDDLFKSIPYILHKATDKLNIGLLNVGDYSGGGFSTSFGPFVSYSPTQKFNVFLRYGTDFEGGNRVDLKFSLRFGPGRRERPTP